VECLTEPLVAFIRLQKAILFADLTEVCVPTRFIFIQLGPIGNQQRYHEVGRSIATLMSDEVMMSFVISSLEIVFILCDISYEHIIYLYL